MQPQNNQPIPQGGERPQGTPEQGTAPNPEKQEVKQAPEAAPAPASPEAPAAEQFQDQATAAPVAQPDPAATTPPNTDANDPIDFSEPEKPAKVDKVYQQAVGETIKKFEDKPYEEEEAHEDLQIKYLWQRFKKRLSKSKD